MPPEYEGLILPVSDLALVFETYLGLLEEALLEEANTRDKQEKEHRLISRLRLSMRERFGRFDGGLIRLPAVE